MRFNFMMVVVLSFEAAATISLAQVQTLWIKQYDGPANGIDKSVDVLIDSYGDICAVSESQGVGTSYDYAVVKYDTQGTPLWTRRHDFGNSQDTPMQLITDPVGNLYVTGTGAHNLATLKYTREGELLWERLYSSPGDYWDEATAVGVDNIGNVFIGGDVKVYHYDGMWSEYRTDYMTVKYSADGDLLWARQYNGPSNSWDFIRYLVVDSAGSVYVTGNSTGYNGGTGYNTTTLKYDADGNLVWERRYDRAPDSYYEYVTGMVLDNEENIIVTSFSETATRYEAPYIYYLSDIVILKYTSDGDLLWRSQYNGPASGDDRTTDVAVDMSGNIFVSGRSEGAGTGYDCITLKYDSSGNLLWDRRYDGPDHLNDYANAVRVGGAGTVYVTGFSESSQSDRDFITIAYDAVGIVLWQTEYNGAGNQRDEAMAVAIDSNGQVYVLGHSVEGPVGFPTGYDLTLIKYTNDVFTGVGQESHVTSTPLPTRLEQNFPNPFNNGTVIPYTLINDADVRLQVFDILGRHVANLASGYRPAGTHLISWGGISDQGDPVASGVYVYRLQAGDRIDTRKMLLIK